MSRSLARLAGTLALVVAIPVACIAGVALYGKALSEGEVAIGTLVSPEVARARYLEMRARFLAMTPAEHLAEARRALDSGDARSRRFGGNVGAAVQHLDAIPATAPEHAQAEVMRAEIAARRVALFRGMSERVGAHIRSRVVAAGADASRRRAARAELAAALDQRPPEGIGRVSAEGDAGTTLRLDRRRCDQPMLDAVFPAGNVEGLRALGFQGVRCGNDAGALAF